MYTLSTSIERIRLMTDIIRQYFCLIMTRYDMWRGPVSWLMTSDNHPDHLQAIKHTHSWPGISSSPGQMLWWWSSHCWLSRISSLSGPGLRCRMISLSCLSCHMSDMSHCDRSLSEGNYVKCPHKNPSWGESRGPWWCWLGLSVTVITHTHNTEMNSGQANICPCVLSSLICAVLWHNHLTCESGHCERNNWWHPALSHK